MPHPLRRTRLALATTVALALTGGAAAAATAPAGAATASAVSAATAGSGPGGDFNGDGYRDVAVGVPDGSDGSTNAGWVAVVYGTSAGIDPAQRKVLTQSGSVNPGAAEGGDLFGAAFSVADFDGDGYSDLAAGAPGEDFSPNSDQGSVTLYWGGPSGLGTSAVLVKDPVAKDGNKFGGALTAGDFDGDGHTDLAAYNSLLSTVSVLKGPFTRSGTWSSAATVTLPTTSSYATGFLSSGNVSGDAADDLVVQYRALRGGTESAWYYEGSAAGAGLVKKAMLPPTHTSAIGDIDGDGYDDIVVADAYETLAVGGELCVLYGGTDGPVAPVPLTQNSAGVPGSSESGDKFGASLSVADVTGDGYADVAVGLPGEDVGSIANAGSIVLLRGSASGIATSGNQSLTQNSSGIPGTAESGDTFGSYVLLSDVDGNGRADLTVSAVGEAVPHETVHSGAVWRLRGASGGFTATGSLSFGAASLGRAWDDPTFGKVLGG
jgi:hypothetical protein